MEGVQREGVTEGVTDGRGYRGKALLMEGGTEGRGY